MAKGGDKAMGLLVLVGLVVVMLKFILEFIFKFISNNILIISVVTGISLVLFAFVKYFQYRKEIKEEIKIVKERLLTELEKIDSDLEELEAIEADNSYNPVQSVSKLKSILIANESINFNEIWDLFYDTSKFKYNNPKIEFDRRINNLKFEYPKYFKYDNQKKKKYNVSIDSLYATASLSIEEQIVKLTEKYEKKEEEWILEFNKFENDKKQKNDGFNLLKTKYFEKEKNAIIEYYSHILREITYDQNFHKSISVFYNDKNEMLLVDYLLPKIEQFPNVKEHRYLITKNEFREIKFSDRELINLYEDTIYQIVFDLISILFRNDLTDMVKSIAFNGWSNTINRATGLYDKNCILSVVCDKNEFNKINLAEVDAKECFKGFKGISANKISDLVAIKPIISFEHSDKRFIESKEIKIDYSTDLSLMDWRDFEHLTRELFEREFSVNGGKVRITQSSRDGGVDAIAFDPDPIRGGKIIIQAKRYTNIVGVSAVRDLYGTILNEGATKGILVTTSDYGSDSFKFAKDKPITLMNGSNLLYLLEKHGYKVRIGIKEARELK